jgi:hypothetical protein
LCGAGEETGTTNFLRCGVYEWHQYASLIVPAIAARFFTGLFGRKSGWRTINQ